MAIVAYTGPVRFTDDGTPCCPECDQPMKTIGSRWLCDGSTSDGGPTTHPLVWKEIEGMAVHDPVNHPSHYTQHPSGVECIAIVEHMNFCRGNAIKYIWRAGDKGNEIEDLRKARWYLDREIERLERS